MKRVFFVALALVATTCLFAFGLHFSTNSENELPQGCVPPCPTVTFSYGAGFAAHLADCCEPPPPGSGIVKNYPKLQVYDCNHAIQDWVELCGMPPEADLPCLGGDCGGGCAAGLYLLGYDIPIPATGSSATLTFPGNSCVCDGQTLGITITHTGTGINIDFSCI